MTLGRQDLQLLRDRGISNPDEFTSLDAAVVNEAVRRFDAEPSAGTGALVHRLRSTPDRSSRARAASDVLRRDAEYGQRIVSFIADRFPDLVDGGRAHPAAVATVIRLHFTRGKDLKAAEYDGPVRASVHAFDARYGASPEPTQIEQGEAA